MRGLLADANIQGHLAYLRQLLDSLDLSVVLVELHLNLVTFPDVHLRPDVDDRFLWNYCQQEGWVLFTENRNNDGPDSLYATLNDSWQTGHLPVLTLANKGRFEHDRAYAERVATEVAELLFGISQQEFLDQPRIYVPC
jgi:hypothetical protein